ncbi:hypothetical protein AKJ65_03660 [candidate division MSBL1 archaeon SCGC-AAA259E19]|uniref:Glycosyl transferase family 1 domain-containing protein n=1 Tax=candidate division MSBL1 archaeon SCGC-AAA259E19 TaxID=1698264 RepID=A0A133UKK5_9EURY|nr:hypothetical protein AKJ65_03660 [candidate division MSBL1 archaeon SCGC-AAA259E19]
MIKLDSIGELLENIELKNNKVAILVPSMTGKRGAARVVSEQANIVSALGYRATIFTLTKENTKTRSDLDIESIYSPKNKILNRLYRIFLFINLPSLIFVLNEIRKYDLLIVHNFPMSYFGYLAKKLFKLKYIYWNHSKGARGPFLYKGKEKIYHFLIDKLENLTIQNADLLISVSNYAKEEMREATGKDSIVIYNKVDKTRFNKNIEDSEIRRKHGIDEKSPIILFVGALSPHKSVHLLIKSFKGVQKKYPDAVLIIVGKITYSEYSEKIIEKADDSIILTGFIEDEELTKYYAASDVYASCALHESFNLPLAEAQFMETPVVAFDVGPHSEVVGERGLLVEKGNTKKFSESICKILDNKYG